MHDSIKILNYLNIQEKGVTKSNLKKNLELTNSSKRIDKLLKILVERRVINLDRKLYSINRRYDIIIGQYVIINDKKIVAGKTLYDTQEKVEIPDIYKLDALIKDRVIVLKEGSIGRIVFVLEHGLKEITGTYIENNGKGYVICDNENVDRDIFIPEEYKNGAFPYDRVKVSVFPNSSTKKPEGEIIKVFINNLKDCENHLSLDDILDINKINTTFPSKVIKQLKKLKLQNSDFINRTDLTNEIIFTIDGEDSKDLDDAISIKQLNNGNFELGVHIADVSHYVEEGSPLDIEALNRGVSVYLIDTVIPMLPPKLSNQLCSLNPNENRLTLSCIMEINQDGIVINNKILESYICSKAKLNYTELNAYFDGKNNEFEEKYPELIESLTIMKELKNILSHKREERGSIEFSFSESKIELDSDKNPISVKPYPRGFANDMIEEFMLITNETIANTYFKKAIPFIYRVHKAPTSEKCNNFIKFINNYGYKLELTKSDYDESEILKPKDIQKILEQAKGNPEELPIKIMALHSMTQARYQMLVGEEKPFHFGLATFDYTHFTSPIRRYPDLMIHRLIKEDLHHFTNYRKREETKDLLTYVAKQSSKRERIAQQAEEQYEAIKKAEYMEKKLQESQFENEPSYYQGIVTNILSNKIEVTLDNTIIGYLPLSKNSKYNFNSEKYIIEDDKNNIIYSLGQSIKVEIHKINWEKLEIIFKE